MKLTKADTKLHDRAVELLADSRLQTLNVHCPHCDGERNEFDRMATNECEFCDYGLIAAADFVLRYWRPGASNNVGKGGIFFTPHTQAWDAACFHGGSGRVVDCCAGIGMLAWQLTQHQQFHPERLELTCVEINAEFVEVGRKLVPQAKWICGDAFDILPTLPIFDSAISNPPFGNIPSCAGESGNFKSSAEFAIMELLLRRVRNGSIVIIPDNLHSQENKGRNANPHRNYLKFKKLYPEANITPGPFDPFSDGWHGASIKCQICALETPDMDVNPYLDKEPQVLDLDAINEEIADIIPAKQPEEMELALT